jgi:outer membrane usher protein
VPEGAFELENIPVYTGSGVAQIVLRDAQGREVVTNRPCYASPELLKPGLFDYSIETGVARLNHGSESFGYDNKIAGSASLRYGVNDRLTAEAHAEGLMGLLAGGAGAATREFSALFPSQRRQVITRARQGHSCTPGGNSAGGTSA